MREEHHTAEHVSLGQDRCGHRDGVILRRLDRSGRAAARFRAHGAAVFHDLLQRLADRFFQQFLFPAAGYGDHAVAVTYGDRPARGLVERFADLCGIAAQLAHGRIFFENDLAVLLRVDLQRVTLADAQGAADLLGDDDAAEIVPLCQVGAKKIYKLSEKPLISMTLGFPDGATMRLRGFDRLCYFRSKFDRFAPK